MSMNVDGVGQHLQNDASEFGAGKQEVDTGIGKSIHDAAHLNFGMAFDSLGNIPDGLDKEAKGLVGTAFAVPAGLKDDAVGVSSTVKQNIEGGLSEGAMSLKKLSDPLSGV